MKIIRFLDNHSRIQYGYDYRNGSATVLGETFSPLQMMAEKTIKEPAERVPVEKLLAPVEPAAILCIGLNFRQHAEEYGAELPEFPVLFMKNPAALNHPGSPIVIPKSCLEPAQVDYEAELAVIIGKAAKNIPAAEALDYVLGYTVGNDVSARRWQKQGGAGQWIRGKSFDGFCPLGPELVTADEIPDPQNLAIQCRLNGNVMQDGNTSDMIFSVADLISYLSESTTLFPGTVIMTGTPPGVGFARNPPIFLQPGDVVEMTIDGIGTLKNPVIAEEG